MWSLLLGLLLRLLLCGLVQRGQHLVAGAKHLLHAIAQHQHLVGHGQHAGAVRHHHKCRAPRLRSLDGRRQGRIAHLVQLHAPHTGQLTTPALGLVVDGPLAPDAFATWPSATHPLIVFLLGDDAISRLARLTPPIYLADRPPPGMSDLEYYK